MRSLLSPLLAACLALASQGAAAQSFLDRWNESLGKTPAAKPAPPPAPIAAKPESRIAAPPPVARKPEPAPTAAASPGPVGQRRVIMTATQLPFLRSEPAVGQADEIDTDLVAEIQRLLTTLGHDPGPADGILGQRTRAAIADFVASTGAAPGQPLPAVRELLYRELALRSATVGPAGPTHSGG